MGGKYYNKWGWVCLFISLLILSPFLEAAKSNKRIIKEKLSRAGLQVEKVEFVKGEYYKAKIKGIRPNHPMKFSGRFSPFTIPVKTWREKVIIKKSVLSKNKIQFKQNQLPSGLFIQEFVIPPLRPATTGRINAEDPELRKMNRALSIARRNRVHSTSKIEEIREEVNLAKAAVNRCEDPPPPDPNLFQIREYMYLRFGDVFPPHDTAYWSIDLFCCDGYSKSAETASTNSARRFKYVEDLLGEIIKIKNYATTRCEDGYMKESDRNSLKNTLDGVLGRAESQVVRFDDYVEDIERFIDRYKACIERNSSNTGLIP